MNNYQPIYNDYVKPTWFPPSYLFGIVWSILYPIIFATFGYVIYLFIKKKIDFRTALPFILNLLFNFLFTPIQFGLQNNLLALIDITFVVITLTWALIKIYKTNKMIAFLNIPYLLDRRAHV